MVGMENCEFSIANFELEKNWGSERETGYCELRKVDGK